MTDLVNGKVIATKKGGGEPGMPWATVICNAKTHELMEVRYYDDEEHARLGHWDMMTKYRGGN